MSCLNCLGRGYVENEFLDQTYCQCDTAKTLKRKDDEKVLEQAKAAKSKLDNDPTKLLANSIQRFRNMPILGRMVRLRGTKEYKNLCAAWDALIQEDPSLRIAGMESERDWEIES